MYDIVSTEVVHVNPWFRVRLHKLARAGQPAEDYYVIDSRSFCLVIAEQEEQLLLVEQYRFATEETTIEFPMGALEENEDPAIAAARELREETGYAATSLLPIGRVNQANGLCRMSGHVFVARDVRCVGPQALDASEIGMRAFWLSTNAWSDKIASGAITDGKSLAAWALFTAWKKKPRTL